MRARPMSWRRPRTCCGCGRGAPFSTSIGKDVECDVASPTAEALTRITDAGERTRARRAHRRRLESMNSELTRTGSSAAPAPEREQFLAHLVDAAPIGIIALDSEQ